MKKSTLLYILLTSIVLIGISCDEDYYDYPTNTIPTGDYTYTSQSVYYSPVGKIEHESESSGYAQLNISNSHYELNMTPQLGWAYSIACNRYDELFLENGDTVNAFNIYSQHLYKEDKSFNLIGTANYRLENSSGDLAGYYDGYLEDDSITLEYKSTDSEDQSWVNTKIICTRRN